MDPRSVADLVQAAGAALAAARLLQLRLARQSPAILWYLVLLAFINVVLGFEDIKAASYYYTYFGLEALKCTLSVVAVREMFSLIFRNYPGIRTMGRWAIYGGTIVAVCISFSATRLTGGNHTSWLLFYFEQLQRTVIFTLAVVTGTVLFFLSRYPLRLCRNTVTSSVFFSALFLCDAARLLIDSMAKYLYNGYVDSSESVFSGLCLVAWALLLRSEDPAEPTRITFADPREDHLLRELSALNQMMARAARR